MEPSEPRRPNPNANSQTQGYMLMSQATLQENLYAAGQGFATLWQDSGLTKPYIIPGSGSPPGTPFFARTSCISRIEISSCFSFAARLCERTPC